MGLHALNNMENENFDGAIEVMLEGQSEIDCRLGNEITVQQATRPPDETSQQVTQVEEPLLKRFEESTIVGILEESEDVDDEYVEETLEGWTREL